MKKLLIVLGGASLIATTGTSVVACGEKSKETYYSKGNLAEIKSGEMTYEWDKETGNEFN